VPADAIEQFGRWGRGNGSGDRGRTNHGGMLLGQSREEWPGGGSISSYIVTGILDERKLVPPVQANKWFWVPELGERGSLS
jgi:hypothetical protein